MKHCRYEAGGKKNKQERGNVFIDLNYSRGC